MTDQETISVLMTKLEAVQAYYDGTDESIQLLLATLRENQRILQTFNYAFVKEQFYKNAEVLKQFTDKAEKGAF